MTASVEAPVSNLGLLHDACNQYLDDGIREGVIEERVREGFTAASVETPSGIVIRRVGSFMEVSCEFEGDKVDPTTEIEFWGDQDPEVYERQVNTTTGRENRKTVARSQHERVAGELLRLLNRVP